VQGGQVRLPNTAQSSSACWANSNENAGSGTLPAPHSQGKLSLSCKASDGGRKIGQYEPNWVR